jgi:hypothetical protein
MNMLNELLARFPEINFGNYGQDEVEALQSWSFEILEMLEDQPTAKPLPRYTCIGKAGVYELLGESLGAGDDLRGTFQMIYRDVVTGQLYNRNRESFAERMEFLP